MLYIKARFDTGTGGLWAHHASTAPLSFRGFYLRNLRGWMMLPFSLTFSRLKCCGLANVPLLRIRKVRVTCQYNHHEAHTQKLYILYTTQVTILGHVGYGSTVHPPRKHIRNIRVYLPHSKSMHTHISYISAPGFDLGTSGLWAHHASIALLWFHVGI